jgi:bifunctional non-homologous end joining protein LigD
MITKTLNGHTITIDHENKYYFPHDTISKLDLINYYEQVAPYALPHIEKRLLTMQRYPDGITGEAFYQKNTPSYFPSWIPRVNVEKKTEGSVDYLVCNNTATLVYLASQGCITPHRWLSTTTRLNYPDMLIFDLDPGTKKVNFAPIRATAFALKELLEACNLVPFVMTTGSRGVHVCAPLKAQYTFDTIRSFAKKVAELVVQRNPKMITLESRKEKRGTKLLIDIMRNGFGATAVIPYAVRAHPKAPVATPIEWDELNESGMNSQQYTIKTVLTRLKHRGDAWKLIHTSARPLKKAFTMLE